MDTIYALSSGIGRAAIAVVRLSGPLAETVTRALCSGALPPPRVASLRGLIRRVGDPIDQALVLWFPSPRSFTGEDSAEFHIHGGRATLKALAAALDELGCRPAEAGEFTRRAFANGRLDLTEVEGLADLINADTELQRRQALAVAGGGLGAQVQAWRATLVNLLALVEADIDFVDEADAPQVVGADVASRCAALAVEFQDHLRRAKRAEIIRDGYVVVIAGPPNAGKSSLLNALAGRDVAIVSDVPGTTRDLIEVHLDLDGIPVDLVDTAGLRASEDPVERAGMARARQRAERANLVLWLEPFGADAVGSPMAMPVGVETLHVRTKADLAAGDITAAGGAIAVSVKDDTGIKILLDRIVARASASLGDSEGTGPIRQRQAACLARASEALTAVVADPGLPVELMAEHLRLATRHLNMLIGAIGVDDVLDEIFSRFCIGK